MEPKKRQISYKDAGVDIEQGNLFVKKIKGLVRSTTTQGVIKDIGTFAGLFSLGAKKYKEPVLVSSTDGVGTKLLIAQAAGIHTSVGYDLVGMSVNDVATTGAQPLFFLDYIATGKIEPEVLTKVVSGIAAACRESGYALVGGETAEMPDMYKPGEYDLAGFCVGIAERKKIIDGARIRKGDAILGIASSGLHSNGFSLVRKVLSKDEMMALSKELLIPTRLYTKPLLSLCADVDVKGLANITGGAYIDKIPRIIPEGLGADIKKGSWPVPRIFELIQQKGNIKEEEMYRVFNLGIGMAAVMRGDDAQKAKEILQKFDIKSWVIGEIVKGNKQVKLI